MNTKYKKYKEGLLQMINESEAKKEAMIKADDWEENIFKQMGVTEGLKMALQAIKNK